MNEPSKKQTTEQKQTQEAMQTAKIGRDIRFRIIAQPAERVIELSCAGCGHTFHVRRCPENYFFTCSACRIIGSLPGVLAAQIDREYAADSQKEEKQQLLRELREAFPPPKVEPPAPAQKHRSSS